MKILLKNMRMIAFAIVAIGFLACGDDEEENLPQVIADFTYTINEETGTVTFLNTSEEATKYSWNFGDGETSTEINPIKTYKTGTYTVTLSASNGAGGSDTFEDEITILVPLVMSLPANFDDENTRYVATPFSGASFEIVDNPDASGTNTSVSKVGAITNSGAAFEGISFDLGTDIELIEKKSISMNFWADKAVDVLLKLEEGTGDNIETTASHSGTGWEAITFDFNSADRYSKITIFVDGPGTTAGTFYIDNMMQAETVDATPPVITLVGDAEINQTQGVAFVDPGATATDNIDGDISANIVVGGDPVDINTTGEYVITYNVSDAGGNAAVEVTRTVNVVGPDIDTTAPVITLNGNATINLNIGDTYTEQGATANDDTDGNITANIVLAGDVVNTGAAGTYTVTYNVSDAAGNAATEVTRTVIVTAAGACVADATQSLNAADFDLTHSADISSTIISDGAGFEWVDNPDSDNAVNSSCKVGKITKAGNNPWDNNQINLDTKLDFNSNAGFKMKVYSAQTGFKVLLKLEEIGNASNNTELELTTTKTNEWEELTFPFGSEHTNKFDKIVVFFDLNANNTDTYYFDDLKLYQSGGGGGGDTTPPVITLVGANPLNLAVNASYADPGATASDNIDGDISGSIVVGGQTVDTSTDATFTVTYNVSDMAGNAATQVSRTVIVGTGGSAGNNLAANGDFETGTETGWMLFQNGGSATLDNTTSNGGTWSGKIATGGASNPAFKQERIGAGAVKAGDVVQIKFDHKGSIAGEGGIFNLLLFGEGSAGASFTHVFNPGPALTDSWTTFTGTFTITAGTDVSEGISFLIETVCGGAAGCSVSANIDNVSVVLNP